MHRKRRPHPTGLATSLALALLGLSSPGASAGGLTDPTRPPSSFDGAAAPTGAVHRSNPATTRAIAAAARATQAEALPAPLPAVQSVQVPARGPAVALLDGRVVRVGDSLAGRIVVAIDSQGVVLRAERGERAERSDKADKAGKTEKAGKTNQAESPLERIWLLGGSFKQPPGSVTAMQATYVPAPQASAAQPGNVNRTAAGTPLPNAAPGPLSLAGGN